MILVMNKTKGKHSDDFNVEVLPDSIKFYLPRVEGYLEVIREISSKYRGMSLIEFDGYFEGKFEPVKYIRAEIHTSAIDEQNMVKFANDVRSRLKQKSLAIEFNNKLILINEC
jgi:predicted lipase